jgi:hypothetical protein
MMVEHGATLHVLDVKHHQQPDSVVLIMEHLNSHVMDQIMAYMTHNQTVRTLPEDQQRVVKVVVGQTQA